jgi:hypothetical protein
MPSFCRHNRLLQNCPICTKEQNIAMRPAVTRFAQVEPRSATAPSSRPASPARRARAGGTRGRTGAGGMTVRRLARDQDDGFSSDLIPGLKSAAEAQRLADEVAFASARCHRLRTDPPGLYAAVADGGADIEQRSWLAFQLAWLSPLDGDDPFGAIAAARSPWDADTVAAPDPERAVTGPRGTYDPAAAARTAEAYRAWAARAGSQAAAFGGDPSWTPERRFDRVYERLALPGVDRAVRFDLLVTLGCTGVYELAAGSLHLGGSDPVTLAAKRILGIGDPLLLERRAIELASAFSAPVQALDLGFFNWERRERFPGGAPADLQLDDTVRTAAYAALGLPSDSL